jgi:hypothetical protein
MNLIKVLRTIFLILFIPVAIVVFIGLFSGNNTHVGVALLLFIAIFAFPITVIRDFIRDNISFFN